MLSNSEVLVAYNTSATDSRQDYVIVDNLIQSKRASMEVLYSNLRAPGGKVPIRTLGPTSSVQLALAPLEFTILR
jgi:alpha-amylase